MDNPPFSESSPLLAIETSSRSASVAVLVPSDNRVAQVHLDAAEPTTRTLAPAIERLLAQFSVSCSELSCVAVDYGPGSFTGLRVGIAFAKTLCLAARVPIIGIQSLELVGDMFADTAEKKTKTLAAPDNLAAPDHKALILLDAQRGQYYAAGYVGGAETYAPRIADEDWIVDRCNDGWTLAGPAVKKLLKRTPIPAVVNAACHNPLVPEAAALARSALRRIDRLTDQAYRLQPLYIRPSAAEEKASSA